MPKSQDLTPQKLDPDVLDLISALQIEIETRTAAARQKMETEKLQMHHNVGRLVKNHLLKEKRRADYGDYLIKTLSTQLSMNRTDIYYSLQFYEAYSQIVHTSGQLTWSHMKSVLTLDSKTKRQNLIKKIETEKLSVLQVKVLISDQKKTALKPILSSPIIKEPKDRGRLYTYRIKTVRGVDCIDLGFGFLSQSNEVKLTVDTVIYSNKTGDTYTFTSQDTHKYPFYTYKAYVDKVVDGDTLWVTVALGFGQFAIQKIRLKGIDAAPLGTPEGEATKKYVDAQLKDCDFIIIKTYSTDKYNRYLGDVFYLKNEENEDVVIERGNYLNEGIPFISEY